MLDRRELMRHALTLVGAAATVSLLQGCAPRASDSYLSSSRLALLDEVAELMIPQTDTPGARAAGVPASFDKMLAQWASPETQAAFNEVLDGIDAKAREMHGGGLLELEPAQRVAVLTAFDAESLPSAPGRSAPAPARSPEPEGPSTPPPGASRQSSSTMPAPPQGYPRFKDLILTTYYLSEPGATQELRLEPVPGPWRGDIPYSEVGRSWAY